MHQLTVKVLILSFVGVLTSIGHAQSFFVRFQIDSLFCAGTEDSNEDELLIYYQLILNDRNSKFYGASQLIAWGKETKENESFSRNEFNTVDIRMPFDGSAVVVIHMIDVDGTQELDHYLLQNTAALTSMIIEEIKISNQAQQAKLSKIGKMAGIFSVILGFVNASFSLDPSDDLGRIVDVASICFSEQVSNDSAQAQVSSENVVLKRFTEAETNLRLFEGENYSYKLWYRIGVEE